MTPNQIFYEAERAGRHWPERAGCRKRPARQVSHRIEHRSGPGGAARCLGKNSQGARPPLSDASTLDTMTRRMLSLTAVVGFFGVAVVLLLSDRAPSVFPILSSAVRTVGRRLEAITGIDVIDREQIPFDTDLLGHASLWFCGMVVVGFALRKKIPTLAVMLVMIAIGIGFEFAQLYWTQSRHLSVDDAIANAVGIVAGTFVVVVVGGIIDVIGFLVRRFGRRPDWVGEDSLAISEPREWPLEPTATHDVVPGPGDPWTPPGYRLPAYSPPSPPTWRYGSAATPQEPAGGSGQSPWAPQPQQDDAQWAPASTEVPGPAPTLRPLVEPTREHPVR